MKEVAVSIIMPSLNVAPYIKECIESAVNQTLENIEIICVDAGSTDGTWEILESYAAKDERICLIHSEIKSYGAQVNQGFQMARGKYIGILETDDCADLDMYRILYELAELEDVDYAKADYKSFFTLKNGNRIYTTGQQFASGSELYNKVLNPHMIDLLYKTDFNLWRGIYKKSFIENNGIKLNETAGAAYQDIGFMELLLAYANKAIYTDKACYYYRTDREEASTYSVKGLRNTWVEFLNLYNCHVSACKSVYKKGFYLHMAIAFSGEYEKTLIKSGFDEKAEACADYYCWFQKQLEYAIGVGLLSEEDFTVERYQKILLLIEKLPEYVQEVREEVTMREEQFKNLNLKCKRKIVIFGAGFWGYEILKYIDRQQEYEVVAFADNDKSREGTLVANIPVYGLRKCMGLYPDALYVVANERYHHEMQKQYLSEGGEEDNLTSLFGMN